MTRPTHLDIMKRCYENERQRVLTKTTELARELESSAKMIAKAVESGDLNRIAWLTKNHDAELATRATVLHENLHMIVGLEAEVVRALKLQDSLLSSATQADISRAAKDKP